MGRGRQLLGQGSGGGDRAVADAAICERCSGMSIEAYGTAVRVRRLGTRAWPSGVGARGRGRSKQSAFSRGLLIRGVPTTMHSQTEALFFLSSSHDPRTNHCAGRYCTRRLRWQLASCWPRIAGVVASGGRRGSEGGGCRGEVRRRRHGLPRARAGATCNQRGCCSSQSACAMSLASMKLSSHCGAHLAVTQVDAMERKTSTIGNREVAVGV